MTMEDFYEQLNRTVVDPKRMAGFEHDRARPFSDAIGTLSKWYCFSEEYRYDRERWLAGSKLREADTAAWRAGLEAFGPGEIECRSRALFLSGARLPGIRLAPIDGGL
jgi:hypothetical protein